MCAEEIDISRLAKPIESEIEHNRRLIREEKLSLENVLSDYAKLIRENDITVLYASLFVFSFLLADRW